MKILLYGINFAPELTGIGKYTGEMAAWLAAAGWTTTYAQGVAGGASLACAVVGAWQAVRHEADRASGQFCIGQFAVDAEAVGVAP